MWDCLVLFPLALEWLQGCIRRQKGTTDLSWPEEAKPHYWELSSLEVSRSEKVHGETFSEGMTLLHWLWCLDGSTSFLWAVPKWSWAALSLQPEILAFQGRARGERAVERGKRARAWKNSCFGGQGPCVDVFSRWMPIQACSKDVLPNPKWDAFSQTSQWERLWSCSFQISSLLVLHSGTNPVSANELWWGLGIVPVVPKPHGSPATLPKAAEKGRWSPPPLFLLFQGALDSTVGWTFKHKAATFQATTQWL